MGIPTLISTTTADGSVTNVTITSGIDSTYDEYMFVCTDINFATAGQNFEFQVNVDGQSGYNETVTTTIFEVHHKEDDSGTDGPSYLASNDQANGTAAIQLFGDSENDADASISGIVHLFGPASTTYVKHFYTRFTGMRDNARTGEVYTAGYFNVTGAIDEIKFRVSSGNFDGVIQMYGIA